MQCEQNCCYNKGLRVLICFTSPIGSGVDGSSVGAYGIMCVYVSSSLCRTPPPLGPPPGHNPHLRVPDCHPMVYLFAHRQPVLFLAHLQPVLFLAHLQRQKDEKAARLQAARDAGELQECTCCYDDEVLFEDMSTCPEGHLFCNECVRR